MMINKLYISCSVVAATVAEGFDSISISKSAQHNQETSSIKLKVHFITSKLRVDASSEIADKRSS